MARSTWDELPAGVRAAIEREVGPVAAAEVPSAGRNSDFSATLHTADGPVFCKGIADAEGKRGQMHRHEADINPWLPSAVAPRLRWRTEADGWLLLGFDHVTGRHADLSRGSLDLPVIATTLNTLVNELAGCSAETSSLADQWARLAAWRRLSKDPTCLDQWSLTHLDRLIMWEARAIEMADGQNLVHTDLHPLNILIESRSAWIIDWAWSRRGAPAVDVAFLVARLVAAGHAPNDAERWAETLPIWQSTTADERTALAVAISGIWTYLSNQQPRDLWSDLVPAAQAWARLRVSRGPSM